MNDRKPAATPGHSRKKSRRRGFDRAAHAAVVLEIRERQGRWLRDRGVAKPGEGKVEAEMRRRVAAGERLADYGLYLISTHWKATKKRKLKSAWCECERCGSKGPLDVHHFHYKTLFAEVDEDLEALCGRCHGAVHSGRAVWSYQTY